MLHKKYIKSYRKKLLRGGSLDVNIYKFEYDSLHKIFRLVKRHKNWCRR